MTVEFNWFLPTNGDGPHLANSGLPRPANFMRDYRPATPAYLRRVALAAEAAAFDGLLVPTAAGFEDPWLVSAFVRGSSSRSMWRARRRPCSRCVRVVCNCSP